MPEVIPAKFGKKELSAYRDGGETKNAFHRAALKFLKAVSNILIANGYAVDDIHSNKAGIAVSGDIMGIWFHPDKAAGIYITIGGSCCRMPGGADNGLSIMYRANSKKRKYDGFQNCWADWNITADALAAKVLVEADRNENRALESMGGRA